MCRRYYLRLSNPNDSRGDSYWSLGHRSDARWLVASDSNLDLNFDDCSGSGDTQAVATGEVYQEKCGSATSGKDGTGNNVYSTGSENFAFISGATCANVPVGTSYCDTLAEMLPGEEWWGTEYMVTEFNKDPFFVQGDLIRIVSTAAGNGVTFTAVSGGAIQQENSSSHQCGSTGGHTFTNAGDWCDILVEVGAVLQSDYPIVVGQLMKGSTDAGLGDPSLSLVLPTEPSNRFRCGGPFFSFDGFVDDSNGNGSYVNIVAPTSEIDDIKLDDDELDLGTTCGGYSLVDFGNGYSWTKCFLADPAGGGSQHILDSGSTPIGVYVYGQKQDGSYAYVAGMSF